MKTKKYAKKQVKKELKQKDKEWSTLVKKNQPTCLICGSVKLLQAHHIILRNIKQVRHEPLNGVTLCPKHHKYGLFSAHLNPVFFLTKLKSKQRISYDFVMDRILILELLYNNDN